MPENVARLSETFSKAYDLMDLDKKVVLGKKSTLITFLSPFVLSRHSKRMCLIQINIRFLQVSLSLF